MPLKLVIAGAGEVEHAPVMRQAMTTEWRETAVADLNDEDRLRRALSDADALVGHKLKSEVLRTAGRLKLIQCAGAGTDGFDPRAIPPGCALCNVYEHEAPIAEYVMLNILLFATGQAQAQRRFRAGDWSDSGRANGRFHEEIAGQTLGLIGFGRIGREVARRARAFAMKVIAVRRQVEMNELLDWCGPIDQLGRLLREADFVVIACSLDSTTRGLLGEAELRSMKRNAVLINVARGEIVEEQALYEALRRRWFKGAVLDVWYQYPSSPDERPFHGSRLPFHELENVVATAHMAAWTRGMVERRFRRMAGNLDRLARGEPLESVVYVAPAMRADKR